MRAHHGKEKRVSKSVITTLILVGSFILCFMPFLIIALVEKLANGEYKSGFASQTSKSTFFICIYGE